MAYHIQPGSTAGLDLHCFQERVQDFETSSPMGNNRSPESQLPYFTMLKIR